MARTNPWIYPVVVSVLLTGLLVAALAADASPAESNAAAARAGISLPDINTNDPVENEYYQVMVDDDAAEKEVLGWMDNADAFAKAGGGESQLTLNSKIQQRLDRVQALAGFALLRGLLNQHLGLLDVAGQLFQFLLQFDKQEAERSRQACRAIFQDVG